MKNILNRIAKLIDVKSILTLMLTIVFAYITIKQLQSGNFMTIYTMIIGFYFGTQSEKNKKDSDKNIE